MNLADFLQLALSAGIGAFGAWWATRRYQSERIWEKRFTSYVELVAVLGELLEILNIWIEEDLGERAISDEDRKELNTRFKDNKRRLEKATALAGLLLPSDVYDALIKLQNEFDNRSTGKDIADAQARHFGNVEVALEAIRSRGRKELEQHFDLDGKTKRAGN